MCELASNQLKRKRTSSWSDPDDDDKTVVTSSRGGDDDLRLRRRVLELSLAKVRTAAPLTRSFRRRDPPLLRSVLILNTLRAVDASAAAAGGVLTDATVVPSTPFRSPSALDELPWTLAASSASLTDVLEHCDGLAGDTRSSDDATTSSILDDLFGCDRTPPAAPVLTFSSLFDLDCSSVWPSSSTSSADVDLDLDVAMYDFDLLQPVTSVTVSPRTAVGVPTPVCPVSVSGGVLASSTCTQRSQMFVDELERLTQILVGT